MVPARDGHKKPPALRQLVSVQRSSLGAPLALGRQGQAWRGLDHRQTQWERPPLVCPLGPEGHRPGAPC